MENLLTEIAKMFPAFDANFAAGFIVFSRFLGFVCFAPVFCRKDFPIIAKMGFVFLTTVMIVCILKPSAPPMGNDIIVPIVLNSAVGAMLGFMARLILIAVDAGGDMINMQMGLSSAMVLDPTSQKQVSLMENIFSLLGVLIFINIGGIYWLFNAFMRSFDVFPLYSMTIPLMDIVNFDYLLKMTSNVLFMGLQIASPILLATLGQDIILGTISKTAPQVNVFQLSFLFKPVFGAAILIWIMPMMINVISEYFMSFSRIF
ncbi:MAG: flagellar biosynthetic protein FliR [bacterium]|nr:flagellar biosynthetic protein FliR [bacterium]